ncbi:MAG: glycoside hydrolase family 15 protein [Armatimonadetes bacterium]|nr:glycoside hydrolase family 15 protein [Armatimonadota bacterium]
MQGHSAPGYPADGAGEADPAARLDHYYRLIKRVLLGRQDPITGLLPASTAVNAHGDYTDAWVRDNVYSILAVWGLGLAYRKVDWDRGRTYELEQGVVKTMRGLLFAMMRQAGKVERFKQTQSPLDALHAKYDTRTGGTVVGDAAWGHLQLDATALWLLMLGQMTASGLSICYTIDEVNFVQNLVYYIGRAYRTPDYGIWERGNKINRGDPELNASSVGMAKAALEALGGLDLFGVRGSQASVLHALADEVARSRITLESLLPWESSSKEVDAALLSVVGFPAFAVEDADLARRTRERVVERLQGRYGCKRFLRDGHQTVLEDAGRLHYEAWELKQFEHIECEWPLFFVYLLLDALFRGDAPAARDYRARLEGVLVERDGLPLLPELYSVPADRIEEERRRPHSQERRPNANVPLVWAQSLYYLALLLDEGLLEPGEVDPLGRRLRLGANRDPVVQVALLAEDESLQAELEAQGVATQTPQQIAPVQVRRAGELAAAYGQIGRNDRLGLTGRPVRRLRSLTTSRVFLIRGQPTVFLPSFLDPQKFYLMLDRHFLVAQMKSELDYVRRHWRQLGRPTMTLLLTRTLLETGREALLELIEALRQGECGGVRVRLGRIGELRQTAGLERIDDLHEFEFAQAPVWDAQPEPYRLAAAPGQSAPLSRAEQQWIERETDASALLSRLWDSRNLYEQVELLQALVRLQGLAFSPGRDAGGNAVTVQDLLEDVYAQAARGEQGRPYWSVLRRAAGLCDKTDVALADAVVDILVRQRQITVGRSYSDDSLIARPLPPGEIREKIRAFGGEDVRDWELTQEVLIYLGLLIRARPELFRGLLTLRVGPLILLMVGELADTLGVCPEEARERLMQLSPSEVQVRLRGMLEDVGTGDSGEDGGAPPGGWLRHRQREGALNRVPAGFYPRVWNLLRRCRGLVIGDRQGTGNRLDSGLILAEMTAGERNFALWIERLLNKTDDAPYRQLSVEALMALAALAERAPAWTVDGDLVLDVLLGRAVRLAWRDRHLGCTAPDEEEDPSAWQAFYEVSPQACETYILSALPFLPSADSVGDSDPEPHSAARES